MSDILCTCWQLGFVLENITMQKNIENTMLTSFDKAQTADYAELGVKLTQQLAAFEATLAATAKISQLSLLDYL